MFWIWECILITLLIFVNLRIFHDTFNLIIIQSHQNHCSCSVFFPSFQMHFLILDIHEILWNINFNIIQFECQFSNESPLIFQIFIYFQHYFVKWWKCQIKMQNSNLLIIIIKCWFVDRSSCLIRFRIEISHYSLIHYNDKSYASKLV